MDIIANAIQQYAEKQTTPEDDLLQRLNRQTNLKASSPNMLSGHVQGAYLSMISHMIKPRRILEIGTFTGYSAICLAKGLAHEGQLHTIDLNEELEEWCLEYFEKAGFSQQIHLHIGNALEIIPTINDIFDLVFIDADKTNYANYFDAVIDKVQPGGYILADNVLYHGEVVEPREKQSANAKAISEFNEKVAADPRVEQVLITIRDGVLLMRKL